MNYLSVENIAKSYGERVLFQNISFGINEGQKIGFVAKNGTGKTSLLNILSGDDTPDEGRIIFRKELSVAFLSQEPNLDPKLTIEETIFSSEKPILKIIEDYEKAIQNPNDEEAYQKAFDANDYSYSIHRVINTFTSHYFIPPPLAQTKKPRYHQPQSQLSKTQAPPPKLA